jgi:hypothetical protein
MIEHEDFSQKYSYSFKVVIYCLVTSASATTKVLPSTITYTIFSGELSKDLSVYTQSPSCGITPTISLSQGSVYSATAAGYTTIVGQPWLHESDYTTYITIKSSDY